MTDQVHHTRKNHGDVEDIFVVTPDDNLLISGQIRLEYIDKTSLVIIEESNISAFRSTSLSVQYMRRTGDNDYHGVHADFKRTSEGDEKDVRITGKLDPETGEPPVIDAIESDVLYSLRNHSVLDDVLEFMDSFE